MWKMTSRAFIALLLIGLFVALSCVAAYAQQAPPVATPAMPPTLTPDQAGMMVWNEFAMYAIGGSLGASVAGYGGWNVVKFVGKAVINEISTATSKAFHDAVVAAIKECPPIRVMVVPSTEQDHVDEVPGPLAVVRSSTS